MGSIAAYYMNQQHDEYTSEMREQAYRAGAAVAFGLMGMAEAIRRYLVCSTCDADRGEHERWCYDRAGRDRSKA